MTKSGAPPQTKAKASATATATAAAPTATSTAKAPVYSHDFFWLLWADQVPWNAKMIVSNDLEYSMQYSLKHAIRSLHV